MKKVFAVGNSHCDITQLLGRLQYWMPFPITFVQVEGGSEFDPESE